MEIKGIQSSVYKNDDNYKKVSAKTSNTTKKDKIEISEKAKVLQNTGETKNLDEIQKKIDSGFYNSEAVVNKVADAILKEIGKV